MRSYLLSVIKKITPESAFLILSVLFGICFLIITPPFEVPDEPVHFERAFIIAQNGILLQKGEVAYPCGFMDYVQTGDINISLQEGCIEKYPPIGAFAGPLMYIPQSLGIWIGQIFTRNVAILFYLGRFFNLLTWIFMGALAIKLIPIMKWTLFFLLMMPMSMFIAASLSYDVVSSGLLLLFISLVLKYKVEENVILGKREYALFILFSLLIGITGKVNLLFPLLILIIPFKKFSSLKQQFSFTALMLIISVGVISLWGMYAYNTFGDVNVKDTTDIVSDYRSQIQVVLTEPLYFFKVIFVSFVVNNFYFLSFFGVLGWLDILLPPNLYALFLIVFPFVLFLDTGPVKLKISLFDRLVFLIVIAGSIILTFLYLYLSWSPVRAPVVIGIQGRYFLPILPLFLLTIYLPRPNIVRPILNLICPLFVVLALIISLNTVYVTYQNGHPNRGKQFTYMVYPQEETHYFEYSYLSFF